MNIRIGISKTVNIENFENLKPLVEVEDDVKDGETYNEAYIRISKICKTLFTNELSKIKELIEKGS